MRALFIESVRYALIAVCIVLSACQSKNGSRGGDESGMVTIEVTNDNKITPEALIDTFELVPLETSDDVLIGEVNKLIVTDDRIIVANTYSNSEPARLFDRNGKFISNIGNIGRSPEEYINLSHITILPDGKTIAIYDGQGNKVLFFDTDGHFIGSKTTSFWFSSMEYADDENIVIATHGHPEWDPGLNSSPYAKDCVLFTDDDYNIVGGANENRFKDDNFFFTCQIKKFNDDILISPPFCDTIYVASSKELKPKYHLDMSKINVKTNYDENMTLAEFADIRKQYATFYGGFCEGESFLMWNIALPPDGVNESYVYNKSTGETFLIEQDPDSGRHFIDGNMPFGTSLDNNQLASVVSAYIITEWSTEEFRHNYPELEGVTDESNPVVIIYTLKKDWK
jgi:hypothetical protein